MKRIKSKKSDDELIKFVWGRKKEYDYFLLLEVQSRNPFSFKKPKPVWEEIAKKLRERDLKMRVTDRSCRDRVNDLLKKHRKAEAEIMRSTGAVDDDVTEIKKLLIIVNEMALTKPDETLSSMYQKIAKNKGESIRDAALNEVSDSDSDDYIQGNYSTKNSLDVSGENSHRNVEVEYVTDISGFFTDKPMSMAEENLMIDEEMSQSWRDIPSSSRENQYSIPEADLAPQLNEDSGANDGQSARETNSVAMQNTFESARSTTTPAISSTTLATSSTTPATLSTTPAITPATTSAITPAITPAITRAITPATTSTTPATPVTSISATNNRLSNPKKDLINYLEKKSENETDLRREEISVRKMEVDIKRDELQILRIKTEAEVKAKIRSQELEAENKREELKILRMKTESEAEERKRMQDLLIALITKNNNSNGQ